MENSNFARPAMIADAKGNAHMVGFVVGPDFHMSAAFVPISLGDGAQHLGFDVGFRISSSVSLTVCNIWPLCACFGLVTFYTYEEVPLAEGIRAGR